MAVPRYKGGARPDAGGTALPTEQSRAFGSLANRIDNFAGMAVDKYAKETAVEAKQDAEQAFAQRGMQAKVNDDMTVYGQTYTNALSNMHKKKLAIDTGVAVREAYNQYEDNPVAFEAATKEIYGKTAELLPDHLQADYAIDFEANKAHYAGQVYNNRIKLDQQRDIALTNELFTQSKDNATRASREGNHDLAFYEMQKGIAGLDSALENKTITPEQHRKGIEEMKFDTSVSMFKGVNDSHLQSGDLQGSQDYIESFRTSQPEGFDDRQREALADEMQGELNAVIRQQKVVATAAKEEATFAVKDAKKIFDSGQKPENLSAVDEAVQFVSPSLQHEYNVSKEAYRMQQKAGFLTLPEQMAVANEMVASPEASRVEIEALKQVKKNLSDKMAMAEKDPYSLAVQDNIFDQAGVLIPSQGNQAIAQILPIRATQSKLAKAAYGTKTKLFTDAEAQQYTAWLDDPNTSISDKLDFIETVETSTPNESMLVYEQLQEKGASVFAFAGSMVKKGDRQKAEKMLRGQIILREQPGVVPFDDMQWKLNGTIGNALMYQGQGSRKALSEASTAYYAALAEESGKLSKESAPLNLVKQAVTDVTGGVGKINDQNYFLPPQATEGDVEEWIDNLEPDDFTNVSGITPEQAVSVAQRGQLISVGTGKYQILYQGRRLTGADGKALIMEYSR